MSGGKLLVDEVHRHTFEPQALLQVLAARAAVEPRQAYELAIDRAEPVLVFFRPAQEVHLARAFLDGVRNRAGE